MLHMWNFPSQRFSSAVCFVSTTLEQITSSINEAVLVNTISWHHSEIQLSQLIILCKF